jgi:hypothetical protein
MRAINSIEDGESDGVLGPTVRRSVSNSTPTERIIDNYARLSTIRPYSARMVERLLRNLG